MLEGELNLNAMLNIDYSVLDKGIILIFDQKMYLSNVRTSRDYKVVVKAPSPQVHNISVVILNDVNDVDIKWEDIISEIKRQYGANLIALLDSDGNKI